MTGLISLSNNHNVYSQGVSVEMMNYISGSYLFNLDESIL